MKLAAVKGITPVSTQSIEHTERELTTLIIESRGPESAHDPGIALAARDAAELAHTNHASLVAMVDHADADPAVLVGMVVTADTPHAPSAPEDLRHYLEETATPDIREVTQTHTTRGYPVIIAERILPTACQLQAVVLEPAGRGMAVFTLHSTTGRGWLELAALLGELVSTVDFRV